MMNDVLEKMCFYVAGLLTSLNETEITEKLEVYRGNIAIRHSNVVTHCFSISLNKRLINSKIFLNAKNSIILSFLDHEI